MHHFLLPGYGSQVKVNVLLSVSELVCVLVSTLVNLSTCQAVKFLFKKMSRELSNFFLQNAA